MSESAEASPSVSTTDSHGTAASLVRFFQMTSTSFKPKRAVVLNVKRPLYPVPLLGFFFILQSARSDKMSGVGPVSFESRHLYRLPSTLRLCSYKPSGNSN